MNLEYFALIQRFISRKNSRERKMKLRQLVNLENKAIERAKQVTEDRKRHFKDKNLMKEVEFGPKKQMLLQKEHLYVL